MANTESSIPDPNAGGSEHARPFRVLSLDGGGIRGLYTAAYIERLVHHFAVARGEASLDLGKGFDLITGTSTGAIVAAALAVGRPMSEVVRLYHAHGRSIFPHRINGLPSALMHAAFGRSYTRKGDDALRRALSDVLGSTTILDVYQQRGISLSVPAVLMSAHRAWVFKKTAKSGARDDLYKLVDVCMASTAAPIFRSLAAIDDPASEHGVKQVFADGGLWANNPVLVGLTDALTLAGMDRPIQIFSLGTCPRPEGEHLEGGQVHRSLLDWRFGADVAPLSIAAQEFAFDHMARLISNALRACGHKIETLRFPNKAVPASMMPFLGIDDARPAAMKRLIQQAHDDADLTKSDCDDPHKPNGRLIRSLMESLPPMPKAGVRPVPVLSPANEVDDVRLR